MYFRALMQKRVMPQQKSVITLKEEKIQSNSLRIKFTTLIDCSK
jgi:hypothetical protein